MVRVDPARDLEGVVAILASLEKNLALVRAYGDNLEPFTELEQTVKKIRDALLPGGEAQQ